MIRSMLGHIVTLLPRPIRRGLKHYVLPPISRTIRAVNGVQPRPVDTKRYGDPSQECFVGYYDVQPISPDGQALFAHSSSFARTAAVAGSEIDVGWFDLTTGDFTAVAATRLWCWQLGSRLKWWPGEPRTLAGNAIFDGVAGYYCWRMGASPHRVSPVPLFDLTADGRTGLALNFGRLAWARPGYGYLALDDPFVDQGLPEKDGVQLVDMASGEVRLAYTMPDFAALLSATERTGYHYLNAAHLSPGGTRFSILYKRIPARNRPHEWKVEAVVGAMDGSGLVRVPLIGRASHYWWLDEDRIAYTAARGISAEYVVFDCRDGSLTSLHPAAPQVDGHPSLDPSGKRWCTDTYPDLCGEQVLSVFPRDGGERQTIARLRADVRYQDEWRCDLHPRWSPDGAKLLIDSTHDGFRAIYALDVSKL